MFKVVRDHNTDVRNKTYAQQNPSQTELDRFAMDNEYTPYKQQIVEKNSDMRHVTYVTGIMSHVTRAKWHVTSVRIRGYG